MMTPLDELLVQAKALARAPCEPACRRAVAVQVQAFEASKPDMKDETLILGAGAVVVLIAAVGNAEDPDARAKFAEALSTAVDATRLERARIAQARLRQAQPRRHWTDGANA